MLGPWQTHAHFQQYLASQLQARWPNMRERILYHATAICKVWLLDLDNLLPILSPFYSHTGRPARYQPEILRSLVLMVHYRIFSITRWVHILRSDEILAIACGFDPKHIPGIGTFYDFLARFYRRVNPRGRVHKPARKPSRRLRPGQKQPPKHQGVIRKIVNRLLRGRRFADKTEMVLNQILAHAAVIPSAQRGLLGDPNRLALAGDGTIYESGGSPHGRKICDCQGPCSCPRRFQDPEADWGWDSYRERWVFGHTTYELTAADSPNDLPILMDTAQASRHDSVMALRALSEARDLYPQFTISRFLGDAAHDSYPFYQLLDCWSIEAVIDLNPRNASHPSYQQAVRIDRHGIPICPRGHPMVQWGYCPDRQRIKWRCPQALGKVSGCDINCSPSAYGRVVYTYPARNLRLFCRIARGTLAWKKAYARRTTAERSFKRKKNDYGLENARPRGKKKLLWLNILAGINQHLDAWLAQTPVSLSQLGLPQAA